VHISKYPKKYVFSVERKIDYLANRILLSYDSNTFKRVSAFEDLELKEALLSINVDFIEVRYRYDSTKLNALQLKLFDRIYTDSLIIFGQIRNHKGFTIDPWTTRNEICYYFGQIKPQLKNINEPFSNFTKRLNDSMTFERRHYPVR